MTKKERVLAALQKKETDRVPFSAYLHSSVHDRSVDRWVEFTLGFYRKYDPDYIKAMFDDHYDLPSTYDFVRSVGVWRELEEFDPHLGAFGRALEGLKRVKDAVGPDVPVIETIFLPFHFGQRLAYRRILEDFERDPAAVRAGLSAIARNAVAFGRACLSEAGIDGFFFGAYGCEKSWMSEDQYRRNALPFDLEVVEALGAAEPKPLTILHIHGERDIHFDLLKDYPVDALSWEDRTAGPTLVQARALTDKCLVGGIDFQKARRRSAGEVVAEGREAIAATGGRGFILAPGCTFLPDTPEANILALGKAAGAAS
jgi:uroporphyrinogen decarboxylase